MSNQQYTNQGYAPQMQQGYNPQMQQPQMQQGYSPNVQQPQMQQNYQGQGQGQQKQNTTISVITDSFRTISLFEFSGAFDPADQFPDGFAFVTTVLGVKDASKQSGRRYDQSQKISMKFSTLEIRSMGQALLNIAIFKAAATPFEKFSDPNKSSYSQGQQATKKCKVTFDQNKNNITIIMSYGQLNILIPVPLQDALGLGHSLINVGNYTDIKLAEYLKEHKVQRQTPDEGGYGIPDEHDNSQLQQGGYVQQQAPQVQQGYNPQMQQQAQMNQGYNPNMQYNPQG